MERMPISAAQSARGKDCVMFSWVARRGDAARTQGLPPLESRYRLTVDYDRKKGLAWMMASYDLWKVLSPEAEFVPLRIRRDVQMALSVVRNIPDDLNSILRNTSIRSIDDILTARFAPGVRRLPFLLDFFGALALEMEKMENAFSLTEEVHRAAYSSAERKVIDVPVPDKEYRRPRMGD